MMKQFNKMSKVKKMSKTKKRWLIFIIINAAVLISIPLFLTYVRIVRRINSPLLYCPLHDIFKIYCPTCGMTRALYSLLNGNIPASLRYNPFLIIGAVTFVAADVIAASEIALNRKNACRWLPAAVVVFLICMILFTVMRDVMLIAFKIDVPGDFL